MRIAITGIGIVSPLGVGQAENLTHFLNKTSCVGAAQFLNTCHKEWPVGEVPMTNEELKSKLSLEVSQVISRTSLLGTLAAKEAIVDAGLNENDLNEIVFISGTTVGGMDVTEDYIKDWTNTDYKAIDIIKQHSAGYSSEFISNYLKIKKYSTISTACSSALNAIVLGANLIRMGKTKRVLVGGTEALSKFHLNGFAALGILSQQVCRPFQEDRDGINLAEGAGYLVLETEDMARNRGSKNYGYLAGYANCCDAFHATASSPEGNGAYEAMASALAMAGVEPQMVDYINAHGTGTQNNDSSEANAIARLFPNGVSYESTKNLTGHTTSASGAIETIFSLMKMREEHLSCVMDNAFGFGGNDSSVVLTKSPIELPSVETCDNFEKIEINIEGEVDYKPYIPVMQARRMTPQMRRLMVAVKQALSQANIEKPDAIIVGTNWGGMVPSMSLLNQLVEQGENGLSPAQFTQSTHNSMAGTLAINLGVKGYNCTFSNGCLSYSDAYADAVCQLSVGTAKSVLVCEFDEEIEPWQTFLLQANIPAKNRAKATVLKIK